MIHQSNVRFSEREISVEEAIRGRKSVRAFKDTPLPPGLVAHILEIASRSPSGSNTQPWKVWVLEGPVKEQLSKEILEIYDATGEGEREYNYYPVKWRDPYLRRRRACGWGLYSSVGITRGDAAGMHRQRRQNFAFFGAPVGLVFSIDRDMEQGSWLDFGMFLQSIMVAARQYWVETCPLAAFGSFYSLIQRRVGFPESEMLVCGMALGYADRDAKVNLFTTDREPLDTFVRWVDELR